jgi:hypothetical protein
MNSKGKIILTILFFTFLTSALLVGQETPAQDSLKIAGRLTVNGQILPFTIDECGDTIILANLQDITVSSLRDIATQEDWRRYRRYKRYALEVYPYAVEAIKVFRQVEYVTQEMEEHQRKKYIKDLRKQMKEKFKNPLTDLSKTQGLILFKMIEKELNTPVYDLIRDLRNGLSATYWSTVGSFYGHDLKEGYIPGEDPILDAVLNDLDVSYEVSKD